jgi:hypothetical protein
VENDQQKSGREKPATDDAKISNWALFFPEGLIAFGLVVASPFIAGSYFDDGLAGQGVLTIVLTGLASSGFIVCLSKDRRWGAWACMFGLILGMALISQTIPQH